MLVNKLGAVVNLVVDHDVEVLLGVVLGNILIGELLRRGHLDCTVEAWRLSSSNCRAIFLDSCFVSTVRADARRKTAQLEAIGSEAYQKSETWARRALICVGTAAGWWEVVYGGKGAVAKKIKRFRPASGEGTPEDWRQGDGLCLNPWAGAPLGMPLGSLWPIRTR